MADGHGIFRALEVSVEAADTLASHVQAAKDLTNASIGSAKNKYKEEAIKLREKLQKMHREQIERLNADNVVRDNWINQFVEDLD